jgi:integrative and conjugative element protein (TIGR02256 family)
MSKSLSITAWISKAALASMLKEANRCLPNETGGVFMGYWSDSRSVVITNVIGPGPNARHCQYSFHPDVKYHDGEIERIYLRSSRLHTYLGDWHTHPKGSISTSRKDRKTLLAIAFDPWARAPRPLMGILAGRHGWTLAIWSWQGRDFLWMSKVAFAKVELFDADGRNSVDQHDESRQDK